MARPPRKPPTDDDQPETGRDDDPRSSHEQADETAPPRRMAREIRRRRTPEEIFPDHPERAPVLAHVVREIGNIFFRHRLSQRLTPAEQTAIVDQFVKQYVSRANKSSLAVAPIPTEAVELWSDRTPHPDLERIETPVEFTRRVYGSWLSKGLTRAHLRGLDPPLYQALSVWMRRHPDDVIEELPPLTQVIDERIAKLSAEFSPDDLRKLGLAIQSRLRRQP